MNFDKSGWIHCLLWGNFVNLLNFVNEISWNYVKFVIFCLILCKSKNFCLNFAKMTKKICYYFLKFCFKSCNANNTKLGPISSGTLIILHSILFKKILKTSFNFSIGLFCFVS